MSDCGKCLGEMRKQGKKKVSYSGEEGSLSDLVTFKWRCAGIRGQYGWCGL
jgi:hypothetical protein